MGTSLQSEYANGRVESLFVHRRKGWRYEIGFVGGDYSATSSLVHATGAQNAARASYVAPRGETRLFGHANSGPVIRGSGASFLD